ncbi:LysM peptidoglycan-binding domain-containing protein [Mesobaculum littorinae]|uniref:LysM peptidoglycan-binding domain-containing protein n=1 Tax=Mesobaculum littorinae TaxID=2486419 RepID=A0A438AL14_9RHOB|nr:M23 family metallopeptidase [Mesobaculum littorinae]RVV99267.1 LysM peptidoglycan-binding domain-containing protein [Mesobaculum littorinae]
MARTAKRPVRAWRGTLLGGAAALTLAGCDEQGFDFDLRNNLGAGPLDTSQAVYGVYRARPTPDARGVLSYSDYQVAVARDGDTVADVAGRVGLPAVELANYNGLPIGAELKHGEIVALPSRVAEPQGTRVAAAPAPAPGPQAAPGGTAGRPTPQVDVSTLAGNAIDRAGPSAPQRTPQATPAAQPSGQTSAPARSDGDPQRHRVEHGETAYSIARKYNVPAKALADWNGLGPDMSVREGAWLLIPVAEPGTTPQPDPEKTSRPGEGSPTPTPPSASAPLPEPEEAQSAPVKETPASPAMSQEASTASDARMSYPVQGKIIRAFQKGKNDGIDIAAPAGTSVRAADGGRVAAITRDTEGVPILVLRHEDNLLTVYSGVDKLAVNKDDTVKRGQEIAKVRAQTPSVLHFEIREGFDSVDPVPYLN